LKIDESKCDIVYLINELHAPYIAEQLDSFRVGDVIPTIRKEDLLSIIITSLPLINQQKEKVRQKLIALAEDKKRELNLFSKIHGLETEIIEQNTYLRHTLAGPSSNLKDSIANLKRIILEKVVPDNPNLMNLKMSDKHLVSLGEYLDIIERDATKIVSAVTNQLRVDTGIDSKKLTPIDILDFLEKYTTEYDNRSDIDFYIDFDFDRGVFIENGERTKTFIMANEDLLRDLFDNLIDNAKRHAFSNSQNDFINIFVMNNILNEDQDEVKIYFSNSGKPFPKDVNKNEFIRKGAKFGENAGDGFGGWYINEIIKKLGGNFEIEDETGDGGVDGLATTFDINFPIIEVSKNV
jgi:type I restriction enzyme M protein